MRSFAIAIEDRLCPLGMTSQNLVAPEISRQDPPNACQASSHPAKQRESA